MALLNCVTNIWILEMVIVIVSGTQMTIIPSSLVLGTGAPSTLTMTCNLTSTESSANVRSFIYIQIKRNTLRETGGHTEVIASIASGTGAALANVNDILNRYPNVSGHLQKGDGHASPHPQHQIDLTLTWNSSLIECEDEGSYSCIVGFLDTEYKSSEWSSTSFLKIQKAPSDLKLETEYNGIPIIHTEGTRSNPLCYTFGHTLNISCSANVGSDRNTRIEWYHTGPFDITNDFQKLPLGIGDIQDDGIVSDPRTNCSNSRKSTLFYKIKLGDLFRQNLMAFKCMISTNISDQPFQIESDRNLYLRIAYYVRLKIERDGKSINATVGTEMNPLHYTVHQILNMSCSTNIGSDKNTRIDWYITRQYGPMDTFHMLNSNITEVFGEDETNCGIKHTSTLLYKLTEIDLNRQSRLVFKCMITLEDDGHEHAIGSDRKVFIVTGTTLPNTTYPDNSSASKRMKPAINSIAVTILTSLQVLVHTIKG